MVAYLSPFTWGLIVAVLVPLSVYLYLNRRRGNFPPSPSGSWPIVGHLFALGREPHLQLTEWSKQHGDVFSIRLGMEDVVVLNGGRTIKDALVEARHAFSSRPNVYVLDAITGFGQSIATARWTDEFVLRRKLSYIILKSLGMRLSPGHAEDVVLEEADCLCQKIQSHNGEPFDIVDVSNAAFSNVVCSMVFGRRFDYDDSKLSQLRRNVKDIARAISSCQILSLFPILRFLPLENQSGRKAIRLAEMLQAFIREEMEAHRTTLDPANPRDFIDYCLLELAKPNSAGGFTEEHLVYFVANLFTAGTEGGSMTLAWGILYMILNPDIQTKVQEELDRVVGSDGGLPSIRHRLQLPYVEATVLEIQRIRQVIPLNLPHATTTAVNFRGYDIPAGTQVLTNLWSAHMDPEVWTDPERFQPERFLDREGRVISSPESFMPFSAGDRLCLGEKLAKVELFLLFSALMLRFKFMLPEGGPKPSTKGRCGFTLTPPPFELCVLPR
ncbi:cytochrome P450 2U1-like [Branchiostoma floridae x Branchiostoma japonicum]